MTTLLDHALGAAPNLPTTRQDGIARIVPQIASEDDEGPVVPLTGDEMSAIAISKTAAARREFATDEQVRTTWSKYGS